MSDVYVVLAKRGSGEVVAAFSTVADALSYVSNAPPFNMQVVHLIMDASVGQSIERAPEPMSAPTLDFSGVISTIQES